LVSCKGGVSDQCRTDREHLATCLRDQCHAHIGPKHPTATLHLLASNRQALPWLLRLCLRPLIRQPTACSNGGLGCGLREIRHEIWLMLRGSQIPLRQACLRPVVLPQDQSSSSPSLCADQGEDGDVPQLPFVQSLLQRNSRLHQACDRRYCAKVNQPPEISPHSGLPAVSSRSRHRLMLASSATNDIRRHCLNADLDRADVSLRNGP
jgi:hypothetical protein